MIPRFSSAAVAWCILLVFRLAVKGKFMTPESRPAVMEIYMMVQGSGAVGKNRPFYLMYSCYCK